ncbi:hypothetical protein IWX90DRAFT_186197 [Phyllosticta citrichinensis]|uniref:Uncharacterized protein n=1 Tax=Phyllosticta citrichinensis TaxID=1130410 RepID=A0ABR1XW60_9PEZI
MSWSLADIWTALEDEKNPVKGENEHGSATVRQNVVKINCPSALFAHPGHAKPVTLLFLLVESEVQSRRSGAEQVVVSFGLHSCSGDWPSRRSRKSQAIFLFLCGEWYAGNICMRRRSRMGVKQKASFDNGLVTVLALRGITFAWRGITFAWRRYIKVGRIHLESIISSFYRAINSSHRQDFPKNLNFISFRRSKHGLFPE